MKFVFRSIVDTSSSQRSQAQARLKAQSKSAFLQSESESLKKISPFYLLFVTLNGL